MEAPPQTAVFADRFAALGTESRLRIVQILLQAHPQGVVAGELQSQLGISNSNLSHHLDKLKNEDLIQVTRQGTFLRYRANPPALQELLDYLYADCCKGNQSCHPSPKP